MAGDFQFAVAPRWAASWFSWPATPFTTTPCCSPIARDTASPSAPSSAAPLPRSRMSAPGRPRANAAVPARRVLDDRVPLAHRPTAQPKESSCLRSLQPPPEPPRPARTRRRRVAVQHPARAAQPPINTLKNSVFGGRTDTAINGYDTVAYFTEGKPVQGRDNLVYEWMGAKWKFSSQANLDLFKANPEKYAPQYGGYCAYGVAQDALVKVEPDQVHRARRQALPQLRRRRAGQVVEGPGGLHQGCRRPVSHASEQVSHQ